MEEEIKSLSKIILEAMRYYDINLDKLARMSGISERHLEALLEERFKQLPSAPYIHGYLNKIAALLNLNGEDLWRVYLKDNQSLRRSGERDQLPPNRFSYRLWLSRPIVFVIAGLAIVGLYIFFHVSFFFNKPDLVFEDLDNDSLIVSEEKFIFHGQIEAPASLSINDEEINLNPDGSFEKTVYLNAGVNVFTFKAKKVLGKELNIIKQIFYEPATSTSNQASRSINPVSIPIEEALKPESVPTGANAGF